MTPRTFLFILLDEGKTVNLIGMNVDKWTFDDLVRVIEEYKTYKRAMNSTLNRRHDKRG